jgi:hypothetical protein
MNMEDSALKVPLVIIVCFYIVLWLYFLCNNKNYRRLDENSSMHKSRT